MRGGIIIVCLAVYVQYGLGENNGLGLTPVMGFMNWERFRYDSSFYPGWPKLQYRTLLYMKIHNFLTSSYVQKLGENINSQQGIDLDKKIKSNF